MQDQTKIDVYRKVYAIAKENPHVKNIGYPREKKDLDFFFEVGDASVTFKLKAKADFFTIRATRLYEDKNDDELYEIGTRLTEGTSYQHTEYDGKLIVICQMALVGVADNDASQKTIKAFKEFVAFLETHYTEDGLVFNDYEDVDSAKAAEIFAEQVDNSQATETEVEQKPAIAEDQAQESHADEKPVESETKIEEPKEPEPVKEEPVVKKAEVQKPETPSFPPSNAPRTIKEMYAEMNEIFNQREKQLSYLEETVQLKEKYVNGLLEKQKSQMESINRSNAELEAAKTALAKREDELSKKTAKYRSDLDTLTVAQKDVATREEKATAAEADLNKREEELSSLMEEIDSERTLLKLRKEQLDKLSNALDKRSQTVEDAEKSCATKIEDAEHKTERARIEMNNLEVLKRNVASMQNAINSRAELVSMQEEAIATQNPEDKRLELLKLINDLAEKERTIDAKDKQLREIMSQSDGNALSAEDFATVCEEYNFTTTAEGNLTAQSDGISITADVNTHMITVSAVFDKKDGKNKISAMRAFNKNGSGHISYIDGTTLFVAGFYIGNPLQTVESLLEEIRGM